MQGFYLFDWVLRCCAFGVDRAMQLILGGLFRWTSTKDAVVSNSSGSWRCPRRATSSRWSSSGTERPPESASIRSTWPRWPAAPWWPVPALWWPVVTADPPSHPRRRPSMPRTSALNPIARLVHRAPISMSTRKKAIFIHLIVLEKKH